MSLLWAKDIELKESCSGDVALVRSKYMQAPPYAAWHPSNVIVTAIPVRDIVASPLILYAMAPPYPLFALHLTNVGASSFALMTTDPQVISACSFTSVVTVSEILFFVMVVVTFDSMPPASSRLMAPPFWSVSRHTYRPYDWMLQNSATTPRMAAPP